MWNCHPERRNPWARSGASRSGPAQVCTAVVDFAEHEGHGPPRSCVSMKPSIKDVYDLMPPDIGPSQRRHNKERLAHLEAEGEERRARLAIVLQAA